MENNIEKVFSAMKPILLRKMDRWFLDEETLLDDTENINNKQMQDILNKSIEILDKGEYLCLCLFHIVERSLTENIDLSNMYIFEVPVFRNECLSTTGEGNIWFTSICLEDDVEHRYVDVHILIDHENGDIDICSVGEDCETVCNTIAEGMFYFTPTEIGTTDKP